MPAATPFQAVADGVRVALKVTPKAAADRVRGVALDESGVALLQVSVTAVPKDGDAITTDGQGVVEGDTVSSSCFRL